MIVTESSYVFANSQHLKELERLQTIEKVFDPASQRRKQLKKYLIRQARDEFWQQG